MDADLQLLVSCSLYMTIIRQRKKDSGEIEKKKNPKIQSTLELCITHIVCVKIILAYCCVWLYL